MFGAELYPWIKALHVIAVIAWMAGMLYLPRLFIYHCDAEVGSVQSETFKVMERRLMRIIINPAMIAATIFGAMLWTYLEPGLYWFHAKAALLVIMFAMHGLFSRRRRAFEEDRNLHSARYFRIMNEVPTVLMIFIVILVIVKPF